MNVLASGCRAAVAAPSEILLQFSVLSLGEAGSGEYPKRFHPLYAAADLLAPPTAKLIAG